jgi:hypothetical protein
MTLKMAFKVNEFRGHLFLKGSPYENIQGKKEIVQIAPFLLELSAFLYFTGCMTLKLAFKINEFHRHLFLEGSPFKGTQVVRDCISRTILV